MNGEWTILFYELLWSLDEIDFNYSELWISPQ